MSDGSRLVTISRASEIIGMSHQWIRDHIDEIPHYELGPKKTLKFDESDLRDYLESQRVEPKRSVS